MGTKIVYKLVIGKSGRRWLIPMGTSKPDYCIYAEDFKGRGYDGDTLSFTLEDGSSINLVGPWCSNAISLYEDTGILLVNRKIELTDKK